MVKKTWQELSKEHTDDRFFLQPDGTWKRNNIGKGVGKRRSQIVAFDGIIVEKGEPDTKGTVDLDDITGTDKTQQVNPKRLPQQNADPSKKTKAPKIKNLDSKEFEKDESIVSDLKTHPYVEKFKGSSKSKLNPLVISKMSRGELVIMKSKVEEIMSLRELKKKIGLYKDRQYNTTNDLLSYIDAVLTKK